MTLSQHSVELVELKHSTDFEANRKRCIELLSKLAPQDDMNFLNQATPETIDSLLEALQKKEKYLSSCEANRNYCIAVLENLDAKKYREAISYLKKPNLSDEDNNNIRLLSRILKFMKNYNDNILMTEVLSINLSALQNDNWPSSSETNQTQEPKTSTLSSILSSIIDSQLESVIWSNAKDFKLVDYGLKHFSAAVLFIGTSLAIAFACKASLLCIAIVLAASFTLWAGNLLYAGKKLEHNINEMYSDFHEMINDPQYTKLSPK
jgi:hypothetical protein